MHAASVRCLDMSAGRTRLAVVDEAAAITVYDLTTKARSPAGAVVDGWGGGRGLPLFCCLQKRGGRGGRPSLAAISGSSNPKFQIPTPHPPLQTPSKPSQTPLNPPKPPNQHERAGDRV